MSYPNVINMPVFGKGGHELSHDVQKAISGIKEAYDAYEHAREYDEINLWDYEVESRLGRTLRQANIQFSPNYCAPVINAVHNKMEITSVTATSKTGADSPAATTRVNEIWDDNQLDIYYPSWQRKTLRDGDGYIVAWPTTEAVEEDTVDSEVVDDTVDNPTKVNITYIDPRVGRMFYDSEDPRKKLFFAQMWDVEVPGQNKPDYRLNLFYPDRIEKYVARACNEVKAGAFEPYYDEFEYILDAGGEVYEQEVWPIPNPYGQIPVFHLRTEVIYGKPEHRNAFSSQDAISKLIEMLMVTVEFQGYPQRYALQEADNIRSNLLSEDPLADASPVTDESEFDVVDPGRLSQTNWDNETGSRLEASPGGMMLMKGFKDVREFAVADPNVFLDPWREQARTISTTTDTPVYKFQGMGAPPSGEALKLVDAPLNKKVRDRCRLFGATLREAFEFALSVVGVQARVNITWANPATTDLLENWQLVELKIRLGVPREVAFMDAGIPEQQAIEWARNITSQPAQM